MIPQAYFIIYLNAQRLVFEGGFLASRMYGRLIKVRKFLSIALTLSIY